MLVATDDGFQFEVLGHPKTLVTYHHICFMRSILGEAFGINRQRPVCRVRHDTLTREGDSRYKSTCPECESGLLTMQRTTPGGRLLRHDRCTLCCQRFFYTDIDVNGEPFHVLQAEVS